MQNEVTKAQQPNGFVDAAQEQHLCVGCGTKISNLSRKALRCKPCSNNRKKELAKNDYLANRTARLERAKNYYWENRPRVLEQSNSRGQTPESKQLHKEWRERNPEKVSGYRQDQKQKHREKTGYNPEGRTCAKCLAVIPPERGHNAKYCETCSKPPVRTCIECGRAIEKRGPSKFCNEECKQLHQQSLELEGYTKACTRCHKTKAHTEFRLHSRRRNSVCKVCEANATQKYTKLLPPEEKQKRRRIQRQREKEKEDNLSQEEKVMLTTKRRRDHRRREYGPDFDEDRLYAEQEGKCAVCRDPKPLEEMELDHDHAPGAHKRGTMQGLRGLLCKNCNFKLVACYENFSLHRQAWPYLNEYLSKGKQQ